MRVDFRFGLDRVDIPRFSVEATEGPQKLFTLATLVLNVLHERPRVDVVFHSPNAADLPKKLSRFRTIVESAPDSGEHPCTQGKSGELGGIYFQWLSIHASGGSD